MKPDRRLAVVTAAGKNYVPFARVLAQSLADAHPDVPVFFGLADGLDGRFDPAREPFELVELAELDIPDLSDFVSRYGRRQCAIAIKPFVLEHVLDRGYSAALYLDVDTLVLRSLDRLLSAAAAHPITLVPHVLEPLATTDGARRELNILQSGVYNGGVLGVADVAEGRRFLAWWQERLRADCRHSVGEGLHYDQRWLDLVPAYFHGVHLFRDATVNVAHWNLPERDVASCALFHFSGFDPDRPNAVTRYSTRLAVEDVPAVAPLLRRYREALLAAGWEEAKLWPYSFVRSAKAV